MGSDDYNYLSPETRRRANESELFTRVAAELEEGTKLNSLEARGTLSLALKVAGFLSRDIGVAELSQTLSTVLPGELRALGVTDATEVCTEIELRLTDQHLPALREN